MFGPLDGGAERPATAAASDDISCENCVGACCQWSGGTLFVSADDWYQHRQSMGLVSGHPDISGPVPYDREISGYQKIADGPGKWRTVARKQPLPADQMIAQFKGEECRNLGQPEGDSTLRPCRIYEDRPMVCRSLIVGSVACRNARRAAGLDGGQKITKNDTYKDMGLTRSERRAAQRKRGR